MPKGGWREFSNSPLNERSGGEDNFEPKANREVLIQKTKAGKGGKVVTVISGLGLDNAHAKKLLKQMKSLCGTGGTIKNGVIELQGDQITQSLEILRGDGFRPKQSGS